MARWAFLSRQLLGRNKILSDACRLFPNSADLDHLSAFCQGEEVCSCAAMFAPRFSRQLCRYLDVTLWPMFDPSLRVEPPCGLRGHSRTHFILVTALNEPATPVERLCKRRRGNQSRAAAEWTQKDILV